jgi:hypothetical protein
MDTYDKIAEELDTLLKDIKEMARNHQLATHEIRKHLLVREDGAVKNINPEASNATKQDWHYGADCKGYKQVNVPGTKKRELIHRLVGEAFIPNTNNKPYINHIDECRSNNHVSNLEWCTHTDNMNHGTRNERISKALSKPIIQLTKDGELVKEWPSTVEAGRNGFNQGHICSCLKGNYKSHAGYIWKYK